MSFFHKQNCHFSYPVVSMGTFDGVHLGHQKLLQYLRKRADQMKGEAVVITYYHHPLETIHKKTFPYLLTGREHKERLLRSLGVDYILYLDFNEELANMSPDDFLRNILLNEIDMKEIIAGYDTHFGKNRQGNYAFLKQNSQQFSYRADLVKPFMIDNRIVSSSLIRDFIREGDMITTSRFLGRSYSISGKVVAGKKIGRNLGFPTINVSPLEFNKLVPGIGVYICEVLWRGKCYQGTTNIGYSPTIKQNAYKEIETFILDFSENLYGEEVEIIFHKKLRDEIDFHSKADLITNIEKDVEQTREYFHRNSLDKISQHE
ncbi:MAG TPA: bifunctional riboflavin kinase/FAD synthetase [Candidatus Cloacimonadota bacterium]|nr:bifunctional riboflavin kinase/FAD synthetase [Candidatus Cloacimonadota bacterium]